MKNHSKPSKVGWHVIWNLKVINSLKFHKLVGDWCLQQMLMKRGRIFSYLRLDNIFWNLLIYNTLFKFDWLLRACNIWNLLSWDTLFNFWPLLTLTFYFPLRPSLPFRLSFHPFLLVSLFLKDSTFFSPCRNNQSCCCLTNPKLFCRRSEGPIIILNHWNQLFPSLC